MADLIGTVFVTVGFSISLSVLFAISLNYGTVEGRRFVVEMQSVFAKHLVISFVLVVCGLLWLK